jgi:hypothetical protein
MHQCARFDTELFTGPEYFSITALIRDDRPKCNTVVIKILKILFLIFNLQLIFNDIYRKM